MPKMNDPGGRLHAVMNAFADDIESQDPRSVEEEVRSDGIDVYQRAQQARDLFESACAAAKRSKLRSAMQKHRASVMAYAARKLKLPSSAEDRWALLRACLNNNPDMRQAIVTLQHRNFEDFSDADVESALRQLEMLGVLDGEDHGGN
jgi:hypothetical protein